eukprot:6009286-Alexandrium_andersonii.AAC.1
MKHVPGGPRGMADFLPGVLTHTTLPAEASSSAPHAGGGAAAHAARATGSGGEVVEQGVQIASMIASFVGDPTPDSGTA